MGLGAWSRTRLGPHHHDDRKLAKVFSSDPKIGYFEQRSVYQDAIDNGETLAPATDMDQMQQIVTNSTVNGVLQGLFALLTLIVLANAIPIWIRAWKSGHLPTTEVPRRSGTSTSTAAAARGASRCLVATSKDTALRTRRTTRSRVAADAQQRRREEPESRFPPALS